MAHPAINGWNLFHGLCRFFDAFHNEPSHTFVNDFCNRSTTESDNGGATSHGLNHHKAEWLRPVNGKQQGRGITQEISLILLANLSDEFYIRIRQKIADFRFEVVAVGIINFCCDSSRHTRLLRDLDRSIDSFFRRDSSQKGKVIPR